jgi:sulfite oxidase
MNGQPLPHAHGWAGAGGSSRLIGGRSAKWVTAITVQDVPSQSYFQALDYRILLAQADPDKGAPGEGISLSSPRVNCDILVSPMAIGFPRAR